MRILLLAMPDAIHNFYRVMKVPNLGLCSIAASLPGHEVRIVDLVLVHRRIGSWLRRHLEEFRPELIGLSCMCFQYRSAREVMRLCRAWDPAVPIVLGGYHATLMAEELAAEEGRLFDFLIRGEGEAALPALAAALAAGRTDLSGIQGLTWFRARSAVHNPVAPPAPWTSSPCPTAAPGH